MDRVLSIAVSKALDRLSASVLVSSKVTSMVIVMVLVAMLFLLYGGVSSALGTVPSIAGVWFVGDFSVAHRFEEVAMFIDKPILRDVGDSDESFMVRVLGAARGDLHFIPQSGRRRSA